MNFCEFLFFQKKIHLSVHFTLKKKIGNIFHDLETFFIEHVPFSPTSMAFSNVWFIHVLLLFLVEVY
jgi:hypothetical protein